MKISDAIAYLEDLKKKHGNLEIVNESYDFKTGQCVDNEFTIKDMKVLIHIDKDEKKFSHWLD